MLTHPTDVYVLYKHVCQNQTAFFSCPVAYIELKKSQDNNSDARFKPVHWILTSKEENHVICHSKNGKRQVICICNAYYILSSPSITKTKDLSTFERRTIHFLTTLKTFRMVFYGKLRISSREKCVEDWVCVCVWFPKEPGCIVAIFLLSLKVAAEMRVFLPSYSSPWYLDFASFLYVPHSTTTTMYTRVPLYSNKVN